MVAVKLDRDEGSERLIKRFLKKVKKAGIIEEVLDRKQYKKPSAKRRADKLKRKNVLNKLKRQREVE